MKVFPIWFAADCDASAGFLEALGLDVQHRARTGGWVELSGGGGGVGVHTAHSTEQPRTAGECSLSFEADEPLERVQQRLFDRGFADAHVIDETFGRSLRVTSPDGVVLQVNESDPDLRP